MSAETEQFKQESLVSHLTDLRKRLMYVLVILAFGFFACWVYSDIIFEFIRAPIRPYLPSDGLVYTAPMDSFMAHIKVSLLSSIIITAPLWFYQIWAFIAPGLYSNEKRFGILFILAGTLLFLAGVCFVYFMVYPMAFKFLLTFGGGVDKPMITIKEYLSFFITTTLVFGVAFEMPLAFTLLAKMGLIGPDFLINNWRYATVLLAAASAMFTPPDVISMMMMLVPMMGLYGLSILLVKMSVPNSSENK